MDDELDRELRTHLELEAAEKRKEGLDAGAAEDAARRALGSEARVREDVRALSPWAAADDAWQDIRYGIRMLRKQPGFTLIATVTLALGVGAAATMFSVVDAVLVRPLPYAEAERLAMVWENVNLPAYKNAANTPAPGNFRDWRARSRTFVDLAAIRSASWSLTDGGEPIRVEGEMVSASIFDLLKVGPAVGRVFTPDEDRASPARVVILGHGLWADRFGSSAAIVGQTIHLNDEPYIVVGVMPRGFHFPDPDDQLWVPLGLTPAQLANHGSHYLRVLGRLKPGVTLAQAQADLEGIAGQLTTEYPQSNTGVGVAVRSLLDQIVGDVRTPLLVVFGIVGLVLLMVCANTGNLLLARSSAREREFAVRTALGASRFRMLRQLVAESLVLASGGAVFGIALAAWGIHVLRSLAPPNLPRVEDLAINARVAIFDAVVALAAGALCGVVAAFPGERRPLNESLKDQAPGSAGGGRRQRLRGLLVVVETALGIVVLVGAGLLLRSFVQLAQVPTGFDAERVMTFRVILPPARYASEPQRTAFYRTLAERLQALPGVTSAAAVSFLPLTMSGRTTGVSVEGEPARGSGQIRFVDFRSVSPGYFAAMRIPLRAGRDVAWSDTPATPLVILISETMARTFWPKQDAIGKRIKLGPPGADAPWLSVAGIVGDVRQLSLVTVPRPAMYFPAGQDRQTGDSLRDWVVRAAVVPESLMPAIRSTVWRLDPTLPISREQTLSQVRSASTATEQFDLLLVGVFAVLALVLAAVGLYGVISYGVEQRTRELGIRVALGARRFAVVWLVVAGGARLAGAGLAVGIAAALALTRLMTSLLFGVGARDPLTFAAAGLLLVVVSIAASIVPALRATRVDPVVALRS